MLADLHNHSCLSPCGSLELSPRRLLELGAARGLKLIALTDHNCSLNCPPFAKLSSQYGIIPIFGMEAATTEEIHVLCLFTNLDACMAFNDYAYSILTPFLNNPEKTGDQVYVDEDDNIEGMVDYYLINPIDLSIDNIGAKVAEYGGIVIPAHADRYAFSMMSQFGVIIDGPWAAIECVRIPPLYDGNPVNTHNYPLITSSDAHFPEYVGRRSFELDVSEKELMAGKKEANMDVFIQALAKRPKLTTAL
jgi:PHP family Zn ribbon phosphoesterase